MTGPLSPVDAASAAPEGPGPSDVSSPSRRRRGARWGWVLGALGGIVVVALVIGAAVRLPYVILSPGDAEAVEDIVEIEGAPTYDPSGSVLFLTVNVCCLSGGDPNVYQLVEAWFDDDAEILDKDDVLQGRTRDEEQVLNDALMDQSQEDATKAALDAVGYEVPPAAGVLVAGIEGDGPAAGALELRDVILAVEGAEVSTPEELAGAVQRVEPGSTVELTVERGGETMTVSITTGANDDGRARIGVIGSAHYDFPVDVSIDSGDVSGPSAGLAFAITIVDELTPGDLSGGRDVAVTGTISSAGDVGAVGGVPQKTAAARRAGASIFLVPASEVADARRHAGDMEVVGVETLDDALGALAARGGDPVSPNIA